MTLLVERTGSAVHITLNRLAQRNALDEGMIASLHDQFVALAHDDDVRVVVLKGAGPAFCSGADLAWMRRAAGFTLDENQVDAGRLCEMLVAFDQLPQATICLAHGAAMAGALGLVCAADIAIAAEGCQFGLTEVRLGLVPAIVAPFVMRAMGSRQARRWFLTAERFDAHTAQRLGVVHEVVPPDRLDERGGEFIDLVLQGAPGAIAEAKRVIDLVATSPQSGSLVAAATVEAIAARRVSEEGREGIAAFFEKRAPCWKPPS
ncbi:MAG TPA: enoyl-CoA hydratase-related protein [Geminicoccus sp.]|jgi:methylglutaconyl-CoA hydratase|uniref:enoyl-CoA hydratase-related protein n=1 Tax=Geminicoccus sp. TaxID=2024832 RepID=UPI002E2F4460|nr:enoyl-CoA hydratase-related protein [Geminicoccus sp.]HEX2529393.1 enoyl-CoA hydratase-related protein [Geminicoccus sp.]